jgi:hypothetical protein
MLYSSGTMGLGKEGVRNNTGGCFRSLFLYKMACQGDCALAESCITREMGKNERKRQQIKRQRERGAAVLRGGRRKRNQCHRFSRVSCSWVRFPPAFTLFPLFLVLWISAMSNTSATQKQRKRERDRLEMECSLEYTQLSVSFLSLSTRRKSDALISDTTSCELPTDSSWRQTTMTRDGFTGRPFLTFFRSVHQTKA